MTRVNDRRRSALSWRQAVGNSSAVSTSSLPMSKAAESVALKQSTQRSKNCLCGMTSVCSRSALAGRRKWQARGLDRLGVSSRAGKRDAQRSRTDRNPACMPSSVTEKVHDHSTVAKGVALAWTLASPLCPLGATAEAGCWKPWQCTERMRLYRPEADWTCAHATRPPETGDRVALLLRFPRPTLRLFTQRNHGATGLPMAKQEAAAAPGVCDMTQLVTFGSNVHEWEKGRSQPHPGRSRNRCWPSANTMVHSAWMR